MKITRLLFAVCALFVLAACTEKKTEALSAEVEEEAAPPRPVSVPAVVLTGTSKWVEKSDGLMAYAAPADYGEVVEAVLVQGDDAAAAAAWEKKYVTKRASREKLEGERDFYQVKAADGKEYWVQDLLIAVDAEPCIVLTESALLYSKPDIGSLNPNTLVLPQYAILGLHQAESTEDFVCVSGYVTEFKNRPAITRQFVKSGLVSTDAADIQAMKLYKAAMANKNNIAKRELLNNALALRSSFTFLIEAALEVVNEPQFTERALSSEAVVNAGGYEEKVNARNKPGLKDSAVIFQLSHGVLVTITAATNETESIGDYTGYWYRARDDSGQEGWVFGAYLAAPGR